LTNCAKCGGALEQPATGRPAKFCSTTCRRLSEYEIRRVVRRLEVLENEAAQAKLELEPTTRLQFPGKLTEYQEGRLRVHLAEQEVLLRRATSEIARHEARLAVLTEKEER
jgi:hypothetical protein